MGNKKSIHWFLTTRGFGSEVNNLLYALYYAKNHKYDLIVQDHFWNLRYEEGWHDYFDSLNCTRKKTKTQCFLQIINMYVSIHELIFINTEELNPLDFFKITKYPYNVKLLLIKVSKKIMNLFNKWEVIFFEKFIEVRHYNEVEIQKDRKKYILEVNKSLNEIWKIKPNIYREIQKNMISETEYAVFHIRRGDKIKSGEDILHEINRYMDKFFSLGTSLKNVYVMSDDYSVYLSLKHDYENINFLTISNNEKRGHDQQQFNKMNKSEIKKNTIELITEIEIARKSKIFIGSGKSNIFRLIEYFKIYDCYDINVSDCKFII